MNVFVVVGSLFPFDRLVREVDDWCSTRPDVEAVAQIGKARYTPQHMEWYEILSPSDFERIFMQSDLVISHAGMGVILHALMNGKDLVVMPRSAAARETTTDHQMATAEALEGEFGLNVAWDNAALRHYLAEPSHIKRGRPIGEHASGALIAGLRAFIDNDA